MFEKILVPLDGSTFAEKALAVAVALAQKKQSQLVLLSIPYLKQVEYGEMYPTYSFEPSQQQLTTYLRGVQEKKIPAALSSLVIVEEGDEATTIVDTATATGCDLIVMANHGRSGISRWVLGSVTERVLYAAHCPVLVVRQEKPISHLMITLDGSELSEYALGPGLEVAHRLSCPVTLLSVESENEADRAYAAELDKKEAGLGMRLREEAYERTESYLHHLAHEWQDEITQLIRIAFRTGPIAETLLETIKSDGVDLMVMATHGRTGLQRWMYGSVTEKVIRGAHCNLLIIRPPLEKLKPEILNRQPDITEKEDAVKTLPPLEFVSTEATGGLQAVMEKALLVEYLHHKGHSLADLNSLPEPEAKALMAAASQYASLKMAQVEATSRLYEKLH